MQAFRKTTSIICLAFILFMSTTKATNQPIPSPAKAKKILMLTSKGGYGHMAACATLKTILSEYEVAIINPFETTLKSLDVVKKCTFGRWDCEQCYNSLLQNGWIRFMNFFCYRPAFYLIHRSSNQIVQKLTLLLQEEKPDLLISTIPFLNYAASCAAQKCNTPFLLVTLDADLTKWLLDLEKCNHPNFVLTVGTNTPRIANQLAKKKISPNSIREIGCPLRKDFFEPKDRDAILKEWNLPSEKPIAMLIRGGAGSNQLTNYVTTLLKYKHPLHLLVCVGRNEVLARQINRLQKKQGLVTFSVIPFTTRISDLMSVTDLLITQPTPNTCNEAMHFGIPILIDKTSPTLFWENATLDIIKLHGTGALFKRMKDLNNLVSKYLGKKSLASKKVSTESTFDAAIKTIVQEMIDKNKSHSGSIIETTNSNVVNPSQACQGNPEIGQAIAEKW